MKKTGKRCKGKGERFKNGVYAAIVVLQAALIVAGLFYGILAECDLREFRISDGWYKWQHERALAEWKADREKQESAYRISQKETGR